jgi:hypothetical protein
MLDKIGDFAAGPSISELLHDVDDPVRVQAISSLNSLQAKRAEELRKQQEEEARRKAQEKKSEDR